MFLNPSPAVCLLLLIACSEDVQVGPELIDKVHVMVVSALKVIMKRAIVDEVDQEAGTVGGVHDGGEGSRCQLGQKSFIIFPILSCGIISIPFRSRHLILPLPPAHTPV